MKKFSKYISEHSKLIVLLSIVLLIPAIIGFINTKINYDILVYLPESVETIKGENILTDDFGLGAYAFVMTDCKNMKKLWQLIEEIKSIQGVNQVFSIVDLVDVTIPIDMLPREIYSKIENDDESIIMVTFNGGTSDDETIAAVRDLREVVGDASKVSSMTSLVIDTMDLSNNEIVLYVVIAVVFCLFVLEIATDSYIIPFLLLGNIGIAILYNMGTNLFLGSISYITQAITAILQLGVTTDFSIFLYHKYEQAKKDKKNVKEAMAEAICETFKSVMGSSLTTFAGFLALCTMDLTLGTDIGLVMAKGVLCGLICVLTLFPALLLIFDRQINKTKHKVLLPSFKEIQDGCIKHYKLCILLFLILIGPAILGNSRYDVYYKLDKGLPSDMPFNAANKHLADSFSIVSPQIVLLDKSVKNEQIYQLVEQIEALEGIEMVVSPSLVNDQNVYELIPQDLSQIFTNDSYNLLLVLSNYEVASDELNDQIKVLNDLVKRYDEKGIVAGEGALMRDLVTIADHDFKAVNYTSLIVIFIIMILVLKQVELPVILIMTIEFAIFLNMAWAYYTGVELPFVASIVVGTIQLGATIDYAILMSTKYLEERKINSDKTGAMRKTLRLSVPSIITSAMCFFAATFGVAIYTKIDMIGSICNLLARGSIISMIVVIFVLPAMLLVFDKLIIKRKKEN